MRSLVQSAWQYTMHSRNMRRLGLALTASPFAYAVGEIAGAFAPLPYLSATCGLGALIAGGLTFAGSTHARTRFAALRADKDALHQRMRLDHLTGLLNREAFNQSLDTIASFADGGSSVMVLFFDLDRFKDVNDTLGHKTGDLLLVEVARRAAPLLSSKAVFARLGGDEFAAIAPLEAGVKPEDFGHNVFLAISEPFAIEGQIVTVGTSVGIAVGDPTLDDGHELLRRADSAMYEVKASTRGGCRVFDDVIDGRQVRESSIRVELGKSLLENEFMLHYQPLVDARSTELSSVEALLRSKSTPLRDVPTSTIIQIAENSGQILELTDWTLDTALDAIRTLETVPVAVNISPVYFRHPEFVHRVFDKLLTASVRPELLTIEVTEGVLISDMTAARTAISRLREIGVNVYLDDFGTGYSSLSYLQHFELDGLKLDKSFLRDVGDKRKATQIIRSIIDFGHSLGMRVVVEGVEGDWQARLLQLLGCDLLQGFGIAMPMPLDALLEFRKEHRALVDEIAELADTAFDKHLPEEKRAAM